MSRATIHRGDLYWVDWHPARGSEQARRRPALIVQTDAGNRQTKYPNTVIVAVTSAPARVPTHLEVVPSEENGLRNTSTIKCEQVLTISKERLDGYIGRLDAEIMQSVDEAIKRVFGLS